MRQLYEVTNVDGEIKIGQPLKLQIMFSRDAGNQSLRNKRNKTLVKIRWKIN